MTGIMIIGHGKFAEGINSVIELIAGKQDKLAVVNFLEEESTENLAENIRQKMRELECDDYLIFTDIAGASPFKKSVEISLKEKNAEVIAGTNVPMLMEILFKRNDLSLKELKDEAVKTGKNQIKTFTMKKKESSAEVNNEDGI
ncbi:MULTISPECIES: PTS galactosamine/N-acetylgalactosamine transporter subunit IIA [unclassified Halanaerobium]|uniref:PTS galactosamine/N-acetylgalactosamine transporter subunit IIA n=1 Tax=unclassified Halanaerobium TaxID=2641197 RepID=UPI000DF1C522|nr:MULTISPECIES: PTS galactosamine/N-acetylgalactosamine transporter subunit IIA [unclassified Halanaerobium]RCW48697.1 PTS system N-acetylgalactosamine-specific IIA component [Halanaerobium sp. MA284_MarDTE_T2]RCW86559.1 PTS system N-acetylgalactosamine-specific IIA component [Halanaerobium sp. DL-01]